MRRPAVGWLIAGLAIVLGAAWFFANFERVTESENVGFHGAAQRNPFLAAERLYARLGARVRELHAFAELSRLPRGAVLLVAARRAALGPREFDAVLAWVRSGGRVIVEAEQPQMRDPLLDRLRVKRAHGQGARITLVPLEAEDTQGAGTFQGMRTVINMDPPEHRAFRKVGIFTDSYNQVHLSFKPSDREFTIHAVNASVGEADDHIPATVEGEDTDINFNARYITDALTTMGGDSVAFSVAGPGKPMLVTDAPHKNFTYLVMPMNR